MSTRHPVADHTQHSAYCPEGARTQHSFGRRGLIAGAAAVVAGALARRASDPVAANTGDKLTLGSNATGPGNNSAMNPTAVTYYGAASSLASANIFTVTDSSDASSYPSAIGGFAFGTAQYGVYGYSAVPGASGVVGLGAGGSATDGVRGIGGGTGGTGVYGQGSGSSGSGVVAVAAGATAPTSAMGAGLFATGQGGHKVGVLAQSDDNIGVWGISTGNVGVYGISSQFYGVAGLSTHSYGVYANSTSGIGLAAFSTNNIGIYGVTNASNQYGVLGTTTAANSTAIAGIANMNGSSAFSGGTVNPNAYAGVFQGNVVIQGRLVVSDPSYKSGALLHPDGSHRLVYCVESPESWIEDFGKAQLVNGKAEVKLDADFAAVTHTDDYHVFLTPHADTNGLHVTQHGPASFTVQEHKGGTANLTFSWRVVAKPKSAVKSERLGKFTMPNLKLPDPITLPKSAPPSVPPKR